MAERPPKKAKTGEFGLGDMDQDEESQSFEPSSDLSTSSVSEIRPRKGGKAPNYKDGIMQTAYTTLSGNYNAPNPHTKGSANWRKFNLVKARIAKDSGTGKKRKAKPRTARGSKSIVTGIVKSYTARTKPSKNHPNGRVVRMRIGKAARDQLSGLNGERVDVQRLAMVAVKSALASKRATVLPRDVNVAISCAAGR